MGLKQRVFNIYRGPGFLAVVGVGSSPTLPSVSSTGVHTRTERLINIDNLLTGEGRGVGGGGAESCDCKVRYKSFFQNMRTSSQILSSWLGNIVDSGIGLSYWPARLHVGWQAGATTLCQCQGRLYPPVSDKKFGYIIVSRWRGEIL